MFNGNISSTVTYNAFDLTNPASGKHTQNTMTQAYRYDMLNRLTDLYTETSDAATFAYKTSNDANDPFGVHLTYDANGNIQSMVRRSLNASGASPATDFGIPMDDLSYKYAQTTLNSKSVVKKTNNKLAHVNDAVGAATVGDIADQGVGYVAGNTATHNYKYDAKGRIISDVASSITAIAWTAYDKVKSITKSNGDVISFTYNNKQQRQTKKVDPTGANNDVTTIYSYDASGILMATYEQNASNYKLLEHEIYGLSRIGSYKADEVLTGSPPSQIIGTNFSDANYPSIFTNNISTLLDNTQNNPEGTPGQSLKVTTTVPYNGFVQSNLIPVQRGDNVDFSVYIKYLAGPWSGPYWFVLVDSDPVNFNRLTKDGVNFEWQFPSSDTPNQWTNNQINYRVPETLYQQGSSTPYTGQVYIWAFPWLDDSSYPVTWFDDLSVTVTPAPLNEASKLRFEISDHLGSVRAVVSGVKDGTNNPTILSLTDYSDFGVTMQGRSFVGENNRFGYQGSERDPEALAGSAYTTEFRMLDVRLGRWFSPDPITHPWESPYASMSNNPIALTDPMGLDNPRFGGGGDGAVKGNTNTGRESMGSGSQTTVSFDYSQFAGATNQILHNLYNPTNQAPSTPGLPTVNGVTYKD